MVDSLISRRYIKGSSYVYEGFRNDHEPRLPVHVLRILWYTYNGEADAATGRSSTVSSQQPLRVQLLNRTRAWCYPSAWAILALRQRLQNFCHVGHDLWWFLHTCTIESFCYCCIET